MTTKCKIYRMAIKHQNIFHYKTLQIYPKRDLWFQNKPSGNPASINIRASEKSVFLQQNEKDWGLSTLNTKYIYFKMSHRLSVAIKNTHKQTMHFGSVSHSRISQKLQHPGGIRTLIFCSRMPRRRGHHKNCSPC
jgi:hypothetical protein